MCVCVSVCVSQEWCMCAYERACVRAICLHVRMHACLFTNAAS